MRRILVKLTLLNGSIIVGEPQIRDEDDDRLVDNFEDLAMYIEFADFFPLRVWPIGATRPCETTTLLRVGLIAAVEEVSLASMIEFMPERFPTKGGRSRRAPSRRIPIAPNKTEQSDSESSLT